MGDNFWRFLIWLDVQVNDKWLGGKAETISGRCHTSTKKPCKWLCRMLDKVDPDHCEKARIADRVRNPELLNK